LPDDNPLRPPGSFSDADNPLSPTGIDAFNKLGLGFLYAPKDPAAFAGAGAGATRANPLTPDEAPGSGAKLVMNPDAPGFDSRVSTRIPTAVDVVAKADPHQTGDLQIGLDSIVGTSAEPKVAAKLQDYPDVPTEGATDSKGTFAAAVTHMKDNMRWIYDNMDPAVRDTAMKWYDGANSMTKDLADQYGVTHAGVAALTARLSPGTDWYQNYSMAKRILGIDASSDNAMATPEMNERLNSYIAGQKVDAAKIDMQAAYDRIQATPYGQLTDPLDRAMWIRASDEAKTSADPTNGYYPKIHPDGYEMDPAQNKDGSNKTLGWQSFDNIATGLDMLDNPELSNISQGLGGNHKIRSFYNNIISPNAGGDVTVDTHQIGAAHLMPLGSNDPVVATGMTGAPKANQTGSTGLYGVYADATRRLAADLGVLPRQAQSMTWEGLRSLFPSELKRNKSFVEGIRNLWSDSTNAAATRDQIGQQRLDPATGKIPAPDWFNPGP
jgi:hypothetical protein